MIIFSNYLFNYDIIICLLLMIFICGISFYIWYRNIMLPNKKDFLIINESDAHRYTKYTHKVNWIGGIFTGLLLILLIYIDCYTDAGFSGWISGIGSMSAVVVALYSISKKDRPRIQLVHIFNPIDKSLTIQALNESNTSDFIKLDGIIASNGYFTKKIILRSNVDNHLYRKLPANGICTFHIFKRARKYNDRTNRYCFVHSKMFQWLKDKDKEEYIDELTTKKGHFQEKHGYTFLIFKFTDTYGISNLFENVKINEFYKDDKPRGDKSPIVFDN